MLSVSNEAQLQQLRPGDSLTYRGVRWQVKDYSAYTDPNGYETTEWLLRSKTGTDYYLLREFDPQNPNALVHWYFAEEVLHPIIFEPDSYKNLAVRLWHDIHGGKKPYPQLRALSRHYYFESQTQGTYEGKEGDKPRTTWDYWDETHQWNLAIEAWQTGELHIYSTNVVKPEEFSEIEKQGIVQSVKSLRSFPIWEFIGACGLIVLGLRMLFR